METAREPVFLWRRFHSNPELIVLFSPTKEESSYVQMDGKADD